MIIKWDMRRTEYPESHTGSFYHCDFDGCSVRFDNLNDYFTVVLTPQQPYFIEEPGVNVLQCPEHHTWLYRSKSNNNNWRYSWRCGVEGCDYVHSLKIE